MYYILDKHYQFIAIKKFVRITIHIRKVFNVYLKFTQKGEITLNSGLSARFILTSHVFFLLV